MSGQHVPATQITADDASNTGRLVIDGDSVQEIIDNLNIKAGEAVTAAELAAALPVDLLSVWPTLLDEVTLTIDGVTATGSRTGRKYDLTLALGALRGVGADSHLGHPGSYGANLRDGLYLDGTNVRYRRWPRNRRIGITGGEFNPGDVYPLLRDGSSVKAQMRSTGGVLAPDSNFASYNPTLHRIEISTAGLYTIQLTVVLRPINPVSPPASNTPFQLLTRMFTTTGTMFATDTRTWGETLGGSQFLWLTTRLESVYLDVSGTIDGDIFEPGGPGGASIVEVWSVPTVLFVEQ
jgi:hypothetical protein